MAFEKLQNKKLTAKDAKSAKERQGFNRESRESARMKN
jgi:hypothetical protein